MPKYLIENKFHCNYCNYKTNIQTNYINHQSRKHNINTTFFACELCHIYRGKTKGDLKIHKANVHGIDVEWQYCDQCDFKAKRTGHLKRHKFTVHEKKKGKATMPSLELLSCDMCDYTCCGKQNLRSHKRYIHSIDVTYYNCPECKKKFKQKSHLTRHMKAKHKNLVYMFV